jgi:hypothetical protein
VKSDIININFSKMKRIIIASLFFIGAFGLKAQSPDLAHKIDSLMGISITKGAPGGVVSVIKDGKIL